MVPAHIARSLHDSLEQLGNNGWFDIDSLQVISKDALRVAISECACMIVLLNDETTQSEWCLFEWDCAQEFAIPVLVVVDMERCSISAAIHAINNTGRSHLLQYQLVEYTERHRRDCVSETNRFLRDFATERKRPESQFAFSKTRIIHPRFELLLNLAGAPIHCTSWRCHVWSNFVWFGLWLSTALILVELWLNAKYTAKAECNALSTVSLEAWCWFLCCFASCTAFANLVQWRVTSVFRSRQVVNMLNAVDEQATSAEVADAYYNSTGFAANICLGGVCLVVLALFPSMWGVFLTDEHGRSDEPIVAVNITMFTIFAVSNQSSLYGVLAQMWLLISLSQTELVAAFDELHPKIAQLGLRNYLTSFRSEPLPTTIESIIKFNFRWNNGCENYEYVQNQLHPLLLFGLLILIAPALSPLFLLLSGPHPEAPLWSWSAVFMFWLTAICVTWTMGAALLCSTFKLRHLLSDGFRLVFSDSIAMLRVRSILSGSDLTCYLAYIVPCTPLFIIPIMLVFASTGLLWAYLLAPTHTN